MNGSDPGPGIQVVLLLLHFFEFGDGCLEVLFLLGDPSQVVVPFILALTLLDQAGEVLPGGFIPFLLQMQQSEGIDQFAVAGTFCMQGSELRFSLLVALCGQQHARVRHAQLTVLRGLPGQNLHVRKGILGLLKPQQGLDPQDTRLGQVRPESDGQLAFIQCLQVIPGLQGKAGKREMPVGVFKMRVDQLLEQSHGRFGIRFPGQYGADDAKALLPAVPGSLHDLFELHHRRVHIAVSQLQHTENLGQLRVVACHLRPAPRRAQTHLPVLRHHGNPCRALGQLRVIAELGGGHVMLQRLVDVIELAGQLAQEDFIQQV